jgi:cyclomaltodextrinase / maltogenic alpha-amylase / neopullulanase
VYVSGTDFPTSRDPEPRTAVPDEVTTAPGDLPVSFITMRVALQREQFRHDDTLVPLAPEPDVPVEVWATSGEAVSIAHADVFYMVDGGAPGLSSPAVPMHIAGVDWDVRAGYLTRWRAVLPPQAAGTVVRYRIAGRPANHTGPEAGDRPVIWAHDGMGLWFRVPGPGGITTFAYSVEPADSGMPAWAREAVIYQIFLDRFHPGTAGGAFPANAGPRSIHGGTLRGVIQALPYLEALGVTCLWLSPFCPSPSYHRYDATDYFTVDPTLGSEQDLRALTGEAHARGLRVMMDFVPSHCSSKHPAFIAAQNDPHAPTASWFTFDHWPDQYRSFLNMVPDLPSFNTDDPGARAYLLQSAAHWLNDGIDAFRLDHAIGPSMDFWVAFRTATRAADPAVFAAGEATDTPDFLRHYRHRLDAVLDFPLARALRRVFALGDWDFGLFDSFLNAYSLYMASGPSTVSFLDNHDMDRFLFLAGGDTRRLKLAALCMFTLEPTPSLYYGTEIGLSQLHDIANRTHGGDEQARRDMPWREQEWDHDLLRFFRALIRLRRDQRVLSDGARETAHLDAAHSTYAYARRARSGSELSARELYVAFNMSEHAQSIVLSGLNGRQCEMLLRTEDDPGSAAFDGATVSLAPMAGMVIAVAVALELG